MIQCFFLLVCLWIYLVIQLILHLVFEIKELLMMCLSSANSSLSAGSSERVAVKTSSWTIAEICSVSDQWAATADSANCTTFAGWTALFTTISHQHGEWYYWLPTWLLSSVSSGARICPSTKLTTCLCPPRLRMSVDLSYAFMAWCLHTECILEQDNITECLLSAFSFLPSSLFTGCTLHLWQITF